MVGGAALGDMVFDKQGNLYGTTEIGHGGWGTVFELTPVSGGEWSETDIHVFNGNDGENP